MLIGAAADGSETLQQLGWRHHVWLYTDQLVVSIDVNDGTQSAGIRLTVSDLKMETFLKFSDTGKRPMCCTFNILCGNFNFV